MNKRVKYICYYDMPDADVERNYVLAATNKLNYIWDVLNRAGYGVDAISVSDCQEKDFRYLRGGTKIINSNNTLKLFPCFSGPKIVQVIGRYYLWICFIIWFLKNVKKDETIIVYHSLGYCKLLTILQRLTKCKIIGEIEEIYQDVKQQKPAVCEAEYHFIESCDSYIFPTHLLNERLNKEGKKYVLVHGVYLSEPSRKVTWEDNDIHVVYAGTFDPDKGGALAAVSAATYLPSGYHIHICGFGNENDTMCVKNAIDSANSKSEAIVTYDGLLRGEDFVCLLQKCQIGLSTQNPDAAFNATSFPSKVLTYFANGLQVVSVRITAVEKSGVGDYIVYYEHQTPKEIAEAIVRCMKEEHIPAEKVLHNLDNEFLSNLSYLLQ